MSKTNSNKKAKDNGIEQAAMMVKLPIKRRIPEYVLKLSADDLVAQHDRDFILSFFQYDIPIIIGTPQEREAALKQLDHIEAICVARLVISPPKMKRFIEVLQEHYRKYLEGKSSRKAAKETIEK